MIMEDESFMICCLQAGKPQKSLGAFSLSPRPENQGGTDGVSSGSSLMA